MVLAAAAVPAMLGLGEYYRSSDNGMPSPAAPTATVGTEEADWRHEVWHGVEIEVPDAWRYGGLSPWCVDGRQEPGPPVVERPITISPMISCGPPELGYGVRFIDTAATAAPHEAGHLEQMDGTAGTYPQGAWVGYREADASEAIGVLVVARKQMDARRILDSVRSLDDFDTAGCTVQQGSGTAPNPPAAGSVLVCRYGGDGWLTQSELFTGSDAADLIAALDGAPLEATTDAASCAEAPPVAVGEVRV